MTISWCTPYFSEDKSVSLAVNENQICGVLIDGKDLEPDEVKALDLNALARRLNPDYEDYSGWDDKHILLDAMHTCACEDCPWYGKCEAMCDEMRSMVDDWMGNAGDEYADLVLDGSPYYSEDIGHWVQECHDNNRGYYLVDHDGSIELEG